MQPGEDGRGVFAPLEREFPGVEVVALPTAAAEPQLLLDAIVDAEVVVGIPPPAAYRAAARLKWVHHPVSGFALDADHPLYADAAVPLTNAPHAHVPAMANWVLAMMLSWAQRMEEHFLNQRARPQGATDRGFRGTALT